MSSVNTRITVNGQTYSSVEQMPPDVRRQYEMAMGFLADKDGNGIPDILEGKDVPVTNQAGHVTDSVVTKVATSRIIVNGKEYANLEDVPATIRAAIEKARASPEARAALETQIVTTRGANLLAGPFGGSGGIRISLIGLVLILLAAIVAGILIGMKFLR
jgi:hypothetical protein